MKHGSHCLVWVNDGAPRCATFLARSVVAGQRAIVVSLDGEQYQFAEEIVTGVGRLMEALDRGSVPIPKWGTC
jgi:hypothetical protein